jgi:hypothetical protein
MKELDSRSGLMALLAHQGGRTAIEGLVKQGIERIVAASDASDENLEGMVTAVLDTSTQRRV